MRGVLYLTASIVFVDTLFFAALTPLLPHYADTLGLDKTGAGILAAAYPAGALVGALPSGVVAARFGVKPTVLVGMTTVAAMTVLFGFATQAWQLDLARFCQGLASAFTWTGALAWLVAVAPPGRRGRLIGQAFAAAVAGALFGPVLGGVASHTGTRSAFGFVALASLGVAVWALLTPAVKPSEQPQKLRELWFALRDRGIALGAWFVLLPALCFGTLAVLGPLRLADLGVGATGIAAIWLIAAALETGNNVLLGRMTDRLGSLPVLRIALIGAIVAALLLPVPDEKYVLALVVIAAAVTFGMFYTPGMTMLTNAAEARGLEYGYAFALINLAWAPGQAGGAALSGAIAQATSDGVVYCLLAALALATLIRLRPRRQTSVASGG